MTSNSYASPHWRIQDFGSGGGIFGGRPRGGQGRSPPPPLTPEKLRKSSQKFLRELLKMNYFSIFSK